MCPFYLEREEAVKLAEKIQREKSEIQPDLVPRYVVPPVVNPRPKVGPLSEEYGQSNEDDYLSLNDPNYNDNNYVKMNANAEPLYNELEAVQPDPYV